MAIGTISSLGTVLLGIVVGVVGFIPLVLAGRVRNLPGNINTIHLGIISVGFSLIVMFFALLVCYRVAPDVVLVFGVSMVAAFLCAAMVFAIRYARRIGR